MIQAKITTAAINKIPILIYFIIFTFNNLDVGYVKGHEGRGFREVALELHNQFRAKYNYLPLQLNYELNIIAHYHAEDLASSYTFTSSPTGYGQKENLWAHLGQLRPLALDTRDAVNCWYTGSTFPGNTISKVNQNVLYSNEIQWLGIGVGTNGNYTVVVANYL